MDQLEWVFSDADLVPLLVQENYANYLPDISNSMQEQFVSTGLCAGCVDRGVVSWSACVASAHFTPKVACLSSCCHVRVFFGLELPSVCLGAQSLIYRHTHHPSGSFVFLIEDAFFSQDCVHCMLFPCTFYAFAEAAHAGQGRRCNQHR